MFEVVAQKRKEFRLILVCPSPSLPQCLRRHLTEAALFKCFTKYLSVHSETVTVL